MANFKMAIIRPIGIPVNLDLYNSQELGLAKALTRNGIDVDIFLAGKSKKVLCHKLPTNLSSHLRIYELPFFKIPELDHAIYPELRKILRNNKYDLYHVNEENEITSFLVTLLGKKQHVPVVIYQGMYKQLTGRIRAAFQSFYDFTALPWISNNVHLAIAKTSSAEKHLIGKGFKNTTVIPVGLDISAFDNAVDFEWRRELNINNEDKIILYVGIFEKRRNIEFLLNLAEKFEKDSNVCFVFVGAGPEYEPAKDMVNRLNLTKVRLAGRVTQDKLPSLYRESSLFLLPSNYEIYGMVVLESMYFGVPVISTKTAGPLDIVDSNINGFLMDDINLKSWEDKIRTLLLDKNQLHEVSCSARNKIRSQLTWDKVAEEYISKVIFPK